METELRFVVTGRPVPKQSFRMGQHGGYRDPRVTAWQGLVAQAARQAMAGQELLTQPLEVFLEFSLPDRRRVDLDNLSKGVLDACNEVVWKDDNQVVSLTLIKRTGCKEPGVAATVAVMK